MALVLPGVDTICTLAVFCSDDVCMLYASGISDLWDVVVSMIGAACTDIPLYIAHVTDNRQTAIIREIQILFSFKVFRKFSFNFIASHFRFFDFCFYIY